MQLSTLQPLWEPPACSSAGRFLASEQSVPLFVMLAMHLCCVAVQGSGQVCARYVSGNCSPFGVCAICWLQEQWLRHQHASIRAVQRYVVMLVAVTRLVAG